MLARDQENLGAEQGSWKPAVLFCFPMSIIRPFHCFSFSHCQTPLGKEMSAHKLSDLAWFEEKTPVTFYQGHIPGYWALHTQSKFPLHTCSLLVLCLMHCTERSLPTAWSPMPVLAWPCPQLDLGPLNQTHPMRGCTEELWLGGCLITVSSVKSC